MKLSDMLRFGFAATVVLALILLPSCSAADQNQGASSSASRQQPSAPRPPSLNRYIKSLNVERIAALRGDEQPDQFKRYADVPFYRRGPIFDTKTDTSEVEQALRDYGVVNIVDPVRRAGSRIRYDQDHLVPERLTNPMAPIRLIDLDPKLHKLRKIIQGQLRSNRHIEDTSNLPHNNDRAILMPGSNSLGHMLHAAYGDSRQFYYVRPDKETILVNPQTETLYTTPVDREQEEIQRVLRGYRAAQGKYGTEVASLIWGRPIAADSSFQRARTAHTHLNEYPRFTLESQRSDMREALEQRGRFRLYTGPPRNSVYKVKVKNPEAINGEALQVYVEPLSGMEKGQERFLAALGQLHLPI